MALGLALGTVSVLALIRGAPLDAPADPTLPSYPRPEWYFLFLFELRRYFSGEWEIIATLVIPSIVLLVLLIMPLIDRLLPHRPAVAFRFLVVGCGVAGWGSLTYLALARDWNDQEFMTAQETARKLALRARALADPGGIPPEGAIALLRDDPLTRGPMLFHDHCAACHRHGEEFRTGENASDLAGFGSEAWIRDLVRDPGSPRFLGHTALKRMQKWVEENLRDLKSEEQEEVDLAIKWLAGHPRGLPKDETSEFAKGYDAFNQWCIECHKYEGEGGTNVSGPDFTGYGSSEWLCHIILAANSPDLYGKRSEMPSFVDKLNQRELDMLVQWVRGAAETADSALQSSSSAIDSMPVDAVQPKPGSTDTKGSGTPGESE